MKLSALLALIILLNLFALNGMNEKLGTSLKVKFPKTYTLDYGSVVNISIRFSKTELETPGNREITVYYRLICIKLGSGVGKVIVAIDVTLFLDGKELDIYPRISASITLESEGTTNEKSITTWIPPEITNSLWPGQKVEISTEAKICLYEYDSGYEPLSSKSVSLELDSITIKRTVIDLIIYLVIVAVIVIYDITKFAMYK